MKQTKELQFRKASAAIDLFIRKPTENSFNQLFAQWSKNYRVFFSERLAIERHVKEKANAHIVLFFSNLCFSQANPSVVERQNQAAAQLLINALAENPDNPFSWLSLAFAIRQGVVISSLPKFDKIFSIGSLPLSAFNLVAICYANAIIINSDIASAWCNLGVALHDGAGFATLPQNVQRLFPPKVVARAPTALAVYCYSKAVWLNATCGVSWYNLGSDFYRARPLSYACDEFIQYIKFLLRSDYPSLQQVACHCLTQANFYNPDQLMAERINDKISSLSAGASLKRTARPASDETLEHQPQAKKPCLEGRRLSQDNPTSTSITSSSESSLPEQLPILPSVRSIFPHLFLPPPQSVILPEFSGSVEDEMVDIEWGHKH